MKTKKTTRKETKAANLWNRNGKYYLVRMVNGKRSVVSLHTGNKQEAKTRRDDILNPALQAKTTEKVTRNIAEARELMLDVKYPLKIVWNQYFKNTTRPQSSPGTLTNYKRFWDMFVLWLKTNHPGIERINQITAKEAEAYAAHLWKIDPDQKMRRKGITANTFNYHIQGLNLIFKILCSTKNTPFSNIKRKIECQANRKDFTPEQLEKIFSVLDDDTFRLMNKAEMKLLCHLGAFTGLRLTDAVNLQWNQIDFATRMITAIPEKTRAIQRQVHIPIHPELKSQLDRAESLKTGDKYVLPAMVERYRRNSSGVKNDFLAVLNKAGIIILKKNKDAEKDKKGNSQETKRGKDRRLYGFHSFRHGFASMAANAGIPISVLGAILGDNVRTLEKYYVKISDSSKMNAVNAITINDKKALPDTAVTTIETTATVVDAAPAIPSTESGERMGRAIQFVKSAKGISPTAKKSLLAILE